MNTIETPATTIERRELCTVLLAACRPRERFALELRHGLRPPLPPLTFQGVGDCLDVSRERARQIIERGLRLARHQAHLLAARGDWPHVRRWRRPGSLWYDPVLSTVPEDPPLAPDSDPDDEKASEE